MDTLERFPRVWCDTCRKIQRMIFDVMKANDKNDHDSADVICAECRSVIATLHAPSVSFIAPRILFCSDVVELSALRRGLEATAG
jgi:hypothetical protein